MESIKIERIRKLEKEVQDFHPLLKVLLARIPYIRNIEYNQGPNENGADFVLEKFDEFLNATTYIGVIVKIGKIRLDQGDVERQIEECEMERTFDSGKKKIFLSEIWIINSDTVTSNAQQKIHHKYKNSSIIFFDGTKIATLVDKFYPEYWTDISVKLGEYIRRIRTFSERITKNSSILEFQEDINIEQKIRKLTSKVKPDRGRNSRVHDTSIHDAVKVENLVFLEGVMGAGKSNLVKRAIERITNHDVINIEKVIPIGMTFKDYIDLHKEDIQKILEQAIADSNTDPNKHNYLIIIDGLDEVQLSSERKLDVLRKISQYVRSQSNLKMLITSRPVEDVKEKNEIDKHFTRYQVQPMSTRQLLAFIEKACDNPVAIDRLAAGIDRSELFRHLPKTPISAILLARILKEDPTELPSTMTELYSKYSELVLGRWDMSKGLQSQKEYEIIDNVCTDLGSYVIEHSLNEISSQEAQDFFSRYIRKRNIKLSPDVIYEKFLSKNEIINYNNTNLTINFKHRTFAEYFSAKKLSRDNSAIVNNQVYDPYWCTVFFFFIGIKRDCPELIDAIVNVETTTPQQEITRIFQTAQYLLAGHLTPYKNIKEAMQKTIGHAAKLLHEGLQGNSPLSSLPPMQLIYLLSYGVCNAYGYDYFSDAIQDSILERLGDPLSEVELIELFLLSSTSAFLGKNNGFEGLINEYGKDLPETLRLGIKHFNSDFSLKSDVTKKYVKKLDKNFSSRRNMHDLIIQLYDTPISNRTALELDAS
ncbi:NACHT domain-containing protein [Pseudomonas extremaustralis]|uniref:NACHT domain-containing protein n=1 Tax=Pseudomonas extremaustralis TaxID=359110 RepID=UPI002867AC6C|nr:NACHT domain-containing protein [Pseudomonas extremaustralis]MDR6578215.1 hypothetical protein [Pseudomonas extremaustralis]